MEAKTKLEKFALNPIDFINIYDITGRRGISLIGSWLLLLGNQALIEISASTPKNIS